MKKKIISVILTILLIMNTIVVFADAEIEFSDISLETQAAVTIDLDFMDTFNGQIVTWETSNEAVISKTGVVKRPAIGSDSVDVVITATIGGSQTIFNVRVLPYESADEILALSSSKLAFSKISSESSDAVTQTLILPSKDEYGTIIQWESSDNGVVRIKPDGENFRAEISQTSFSDGDSLVFLTATLFYGDSFIQKKFYIRITEFSMIHSYSKNIADIVGDFNDKFIMNNDIHAVRDDLVLPTVSGADVTYTSSNPEVISTDGTVIRPVEGDKTVYFTATLENGYENTHITYSLIVKPIGEDETILRLEEDLEWAIAQISSSNLGAVTENMSFPVKAPNGSNIEYTTSNGAVLATDGTVTRQSADTEVTLGIRVYFADESRSDSVTIRVKGTTQQGGVVVPTGGTTSPAAPSTGGAVTPVPEVTPTQPKYTYSDVTPSHWAYDAIEDLTKRGIVDGNDDGTFGPNNSITREAFVKMLVTAMDLHIDWYETPFTDVADGAWYYNYVATAVNSGIVNGIENDFFGVGYNITRQDICVLIYRAFYAGQTAENANCNDFAEVSDYAKTAVSVMYKNGILNGDDIGNFNPKKSASRAEVAAIFYRLLNN